MSLTTYPYGRIVHMGVYRPPVNVFHSFAAAAAGLQLEPFSASPFPPGPD